jgi:uncharacterized protein YvpB
VNNSRKSKKVPLKKRLPAILGLAVAAALLGLTIATGTSNPSERPTIPTPTYTLSPTATYTPSPSPIEIATPTLSPTATYTPSPSPIEIATPTLSPTATYTPSPSPIRPTRIPVPTDRQNYSLSCESSAAAMIASYFLGGPPNKWEEYFVKNIPRDCNPHEGFRGEINGIISVKCDSPYGYGVYAEPLKDLFERIGLEAKVRYGMTYDELAKEVKEGHPVIVWISRKDKSRYPVIHEKDPNGTEYNLVFGEHAVVVVGIGNNGFIVNDPSNGSQYSLRELPRWKDFGNMALVVYGKQQDK